MRKILEKNKDTLTSLKIFYDGDHRQKELALSCHSAAITGTGRKVTEKQLAGIAQVLYHNPKKFSYALQTPISINLLDGPIVCQFVFSFHTLVAIADKDGQAYCDLATGDVIDEKLLFQRCKFRTMEIQLDKIRCLKDKLKEETAIYQEVKASKF